MQFMLRIYRAIKIKYFVIAILILSLYLFLFYLVIEVICTRKLGLGQLTSVTLPHVVVHLDLKGTPLKLDYLESLLPMLKEEGVNGLLMEYEDMFPYEGKLVNLSAKNCYKAPELKQFLSTAISSGFDVIPLVQTFGHLEFALKLAEFQHLREDSMFPDSLCPSKAESRAFITHLIQQMITFHMSISPVNFIHVGFDEVYHFNTCQNCSKRLFSAQQLYFQHLDIVREAVTSISKDTTVLIWDDILRQITPTEWHNIGFPFRNIEPVYWEYRPHVKVSHKNLFGYHKMFPNIWIASAYKGADGNTAMLPNMMKRFLNHFNWLKLISNYKFGGERNIYKFKGIILTGWSRYSHMDPPCELLPVALPSLILNLLVIRKYKDGFPEHMDWKEFSSKIQASLYKKLRCTGLNSLDNFDGSKCLFDGHDFFNIFKEYMTVNANMDLNNNNDNRLANIEYYSEVDSVNMNTISDHLYWCYSTLKNLSRFESNTSILMANFYDDEFVTEFIESKTFNLKKQLYHFISVLRKLYIKKNWQRRPVKTNIPFITN